VSDEPVRDDAGDPRTRRHRAVIALAALDKSDFDAVLQQILKTDAEELGVERVNCWVLESDRAIRCVAGYVRGLDAFESGAVIEAVRCPGYFRALADNPVILADNARVDVRTREFTESYLVPLGITSMMDVPIWVRGRLWGVICHEHVGPPRRWSDVERDFAVTMGHLVSTAVEARERADAERVARFSEFFVGVLSHDLRDPLAAIQASAELLLARGDDEVGQRAAHRIVRNSERMSRMIEQLLDFTRVRIGDGLPLHRDTVDVGELAERFVAEARDEVASRVDLEVHGDAKGLFDADRLWQVLSNLLGNAVEHGAPDGRIRIEVSGSDPEQLVLAMTSTGSIPEQLVPVMFDPFRRHEVRGADRKHGLGLGLFIVREIVAGHGGTITVRPGARDVTFRVALPRSATQPPATPAK
jgi:signal transduction histidine kinase